MIKTTFCYTCNNAIIYTSDGVYVEDGYYKYKCDCGGVITLNATRTKLGPLPKP